MTGEGTIEQVLAGEARWAVVCGDCLDVLPTLPDKSVDHILTDPPYSRHVHSRQRRLTFPDSHTAPSRAIREADIGFAYLDATTRRAFAAAAARLARGWVLAFSDLESVNTLRRSFEAAGLRHWRVGAWDKLDTGAPQFNGCGPAAWGEAIEIAHSSLPFKWNGGGSRGVWRCVTEIASGGGCEVKHGRGDRHSTAKPMDLMLELVTDFTNPDELIVDSFCGGGTTIAAAIRLGRRAIGIEREAHWAQSARERCRAEEENSTLSARKAGQVALFG